IVAIPIAAVGEHLVSMCSRVVYESSHAGPVCSVGRVAGAFVLSDVWEHAERARKSDAHSRIVVYVLRCDDLIWRNPKFHPIDQRVESVVLGVEGRAGSALTERIGAWSAGAVTHSRDPKQPSELVHVVSPVFFMQALKVIGRPTREDELIGDTMISDILGLAVDEAVQIGTVGSDHILEFGLGIGEVRDEGRLRDRMPIEARVLVQPVGEVIRRDWKWG